MTYGVEIYDSVGNVKLTSENIVIRGIFTFLVSSNSSGTISVPDFDESKGFISINVGGLGTVEISYSFNNSTKVFSWNSSGGDAIVSFFNVA